MILAVAREPDCAEFAVAQDALSRFPFHRRVHAVGEGPIYIMSTLGPSHENLERIVRVPTFGSGADTVDAALDFLGRDLVEPELIPGGKMAGEGPGIISCRARLVAFLDGGGEELGACGLKSRRPGLFFLTELIARE